MTEIDRAIAAYAMTDDDKAKLADILAQAYLQAKTQAYQRAQKTAGHIITIKHPWEPGEKDHEKALSWAKEQVDSIASTYLDLLKSQLESDMQEGIGDIVRGIVSKVKDWISGFLPWKTEQVAGDTLSAGDNDGTEQWVDDVLGSSDGDTSKVRVRVVPSNSSSDFCKDYAGQDFSMEEANDLPEFPAHTNCIHSLEIYTVGEE